MPIEEEFDYSRLEDEVMIGPPLNVFMAAPSAIALASLVRLALESPGIAGLLSAVPIGRVFLESVREHFKDNPMIQIILARGNWGPAALPRSPGPPGA